MLVREKPGQTVLPTDLVHEAETVPESGMVWYKLGTMLRLLGREEDAIESFKKAAAMEGGFSDAAAKMLRRE